MSIISSSLLFGCAQPSPTPPRLLNLQKLPTGWVLRMSSLTPLPPPTSIDPTLQKMQTHPVLPFLKPSNSPPPAPRALPLRRRGLPSSMLLEPLHLQAPPQGLAQALPLAPTGPSCPGQRCISLPAQVNGQQGPGLPQGQAPVTCSRLSASPTDPHPRLYFRLREHGVLLVLPQTERPASERTRPVWGPRRRRQCG